MKRSEAVVLTDRGQYEAFRKYATSDAEIYCDSPLLEPLLRSQGLAFTVLNDLLIPKERRTEINQWACAAAAGWIGLCEDRGIFSGPNLAAALYLRLSYYLASLARNDLYAKHVLSARNSVIVFEGKPSRGFPDASSNYFLNAFLRKYAQQSGIRVQTIRAAAGTVQTGRNWKDRAKAGLQKLYARTFPARPAQTLVFGSLKHLEPVLSSLRERGAQLALFDDLFNLRQFQFARRNGMRYYVPECFDALPPQPNGERYERELNEAVSAAAENGLFRLGETDFSGFIADEIRRHGQGFVGELSERSALYENMRASLSVRSVLLDEDMSPKRSFIAAFFKSRGVQVFCVSHANLAVDFSVPNGQRGYAQSTTFVNSEFEKDNYARRGWSPENLIVTGCPRFDALSPGVSRKAPATPTRLVYCGASMRSFFDWEPMYLGMHLSNFGVLQKPSLETLIRAARAEKAEIVVKSHFPYETPVWEGIVRALSNTAHVSVSSSPKLDPLLIDADAMVVSHWSTALIEAAWIGLPVIVLDLYGCTGAVSYAKEFLRCAIVRSEDELRSAIRALHEPSNDPVFSQPSAAKRRYYLGAQDGRASERVAALILQKETQGAPCLSAA